MSSLVSIWKVSFATKIAPNVLPERFKAVAIVSSIPYELVTPLTNQSIQNESHDQEIDRNIIRICGVFIA